MPPRKKKDEETEVVDQESQDAESTGESSESVDIIHGSSSDDANPAPLSETEISDHTAEATLASEHELSPPEAVSNNQPADTRKKSFYQLDTNALDRGLSPEEVQEWNSIYASYRSRSILSGTVIGVDENRFEMRNKDSGLVEEKIINSLIIVSYKVKILIPETELWVSDEERPLFVARNMVGSTVDYIVLDIDREGECAVASRRAAMMSRRYFFSRDEHREGERLTCRVISCGARQCTVECNGFDLLLQPKDLSYSAMPDLREKYRPGTELACILKEYSRNPQKLVISVKEALPNPFRGADKRHPIGSRRQAVISGKYKGGVFCTMPDGTVCHCLYASRYSDANFRIGDSVIIAIREFNHDKQQIFGRIVGKW